MKKKNHGENNLEDEDVSVFVATTYVPEVSVNYFVKGYRQRYCVGNSYR